MADMGPGLRRGAAKDGVRLAAATERNAMFARTFGLNVAALRDWEQRRRVPRGPARSLLRIIDREPDAARRALVD
jgi:hypothetical protein